MSDFNEKLERPGRSIGTKARATRAHLTNSRGFLRDSGEEIHTHDMGGKISVWRATEIGRGVGQIFEQQKEEQKQ